GCPARRPLGAHGAWRREARVPDGARGAARRPAAPPRRAAAERARGRPERAGLMAKVLSLAHGEGSAPLVLEVAEICASVGDVEGLGRALAHGYREAPDDAEIRGRLERHYRERQDFPRLAEML